MTEPISTAWAGFVKFILPILPGAAGAGLSLAFLGQGLTRWQKFTTFAVGLACSLYAAPALIEWLHISGDKMPDFIKFTIGLFGLSICRELFKEINDANLISAIKSRYLGKQND